jgi:arylsulfatase A-like enzyme
MVTLGTGNGNPTASNARVTLLDKATSDATDSSGSPVGPANAYLMDVYLRFVLPKQPDLTLIWFRAPDSPEHNYGPGSPNYHQALKHQDLLLGQLQTGLKDQGLYGSTNIIVVSDHGHSNVSGPFALFPKRAISAGAIGATDTGGWSVSGDVRMADILTKAGVANVYDGQGCLFVPEMSGHLADGTYVYGGATPSFTDSTGSVCGKAGTKYTTPAYLVPAGTLPAKAVVLATNGGSDYIYVPDHDAATVASVIKVLQQREEVGAIFVHSRYGAIDGTLALNDVKLENTGRAPDIMFSYDFDETATVGGVPGIEFESMASGNNRGMHGSFSPIDVHNTLLASGPDFKTGFQDTLPSGNVDVAPTVAKIFGLSLPMADGRPLEEALKDGANLGDYASAASVIHPAAAASNLTIQLPTDPTPNAATVDSTKTAGTYNIDLHIKTLTRGSSTWKYFDFAKAVRQ